MHAPAAQLDDKLDEKLDASLAHLATKADVRDCCHPTAVAALPQAALECELCQCAVTWQILFGRLTTQRCALPRTLAPAAQVWKLAKGVKDCNAQVTSLANNLGSIAEDLWRDKAPQHLASLPSSCITSGWESHIQQFWSKCWVPLHTLRQHHVPTQPLPTQPANLPPACLQPVT
jgi:hypothetical protein